MRIILGITCFLTVTGVYASCTSIENSQQRLACFDHLAQCQSVSGDNERLACYLLGGPSEAVVEASLSSTAGKKVTSAEADLEAAFPAPRPAGLQDDEKPEIHSSIVAVQKGARGYYYLTLANGHVWREKESVSNRYQEGDQVIISKGVFNSNQLRLVDKGRMVRVERYK